MGSPSDHVYKVLYSITRPAERTSVIKSLNQAYSQRKYRNGKEDRVALNIFISPESSNQLTKLAKTLGLPKNKVIEHLIDKKYEDIKKAN